MASDLPTGVVVHDLIPHTDERGWVMELFSPRWDLPVAPAQWNAVRNQAGTLRGVHVHFEHDDYLTVPIGQAQIGLVDLRRDSPTAGRAAVVAMGDDHPCGVVIPPGVAHGFWFPVESVHVYSMSTPWDPEDDDGCRWDDPGLGLSWEVESPILSPRDEQAGSLDSLVETVRQRGL